MKIRIALATVLLAGSTAVTARPLSPVASPGTAHAPATVDAHVPQWLRQARVPGVAIAKIEHGRLAWTAAYGERAPGQPMTTDTVFNVASLTKPVFALMTLQLVAHDRLRLDDTLSGDWLDPDIANDPRSRLLTARLALSHQTGLPNWRGNEKLAFEFEPGTRHEYSGEGYEYLRRAIEHRTGTSMRSLMRQTVLKQVSMPHTWFGWNDKAREHLAIGYNEAGQPYPDTGLEGRPANAAANMLTTVDDYGRFAAWVARGADLPRPLFAQMTRPQSLNTHPAEHFGLGWRIVQVDDHAVLSHDGRERGVRTQVFVVPSTGEGLVILTGSDNGELLTRPLVRATLEHGDALLNAVSADVWTYLQRMPPGKLPAVARAVIGSPSFMGQLLYAVDTGLVQSSSLDPAQKRQAHAAITPFVQAMLEHRVPLEHAKHLVEMLVESGKQGPHWRDRFSAAQAEAWRAALVELPAAPVELKLADSLLASYAGTYRMPSSQLLITIRKTADGLQASAKGMPVVKLQARSPTLFSFKEDNTRFEFVRDGNGKASGVRVIWSATRSELAPRVD